MEVDEVGRAILDALGHDRHLASYRTPHGHERSDTTRRPICADHPPDWVRTIGRVVIVSKFGGSCISECTGCGWFHGPGGIASRLDATRMIKLGATTRFVYRHRKCGR